MNRMLFLAPMALGFAWLILELASQIPSPE
jgi:hypothetical protein